MKRRDFLRLSTSATAALTVPALAQAWTPDRWAEAAARSTAPWAFALRNPAPDIAPRAVRVQGRFPADVHGVFWRNGPAVHEMAGERYRHWFDGDGMLQRFAIGPRGVAHSGRVLRTPKYRAETEAGRRLQAAFGSRWPEMVPITSVDAMNTANINVMQVGDEFLALWEGGSAWRVDPERIEARGPKTWRDDLRGMPFSAHPRVDPDGTVWNFGLSSLHDMLVLYQIGRDGVLKRAEGIKLPCSPMVHDFAVTERHLVFVMPPLIFQHDRMTTGGHSFLDSHVWQPEQPTRVLVVEKADWSRRHWLELPAGFLFHTGNAWEDAQGVIRLDYIHAADPTALLGTDRAMMRGNLLVRPDYHIAFVRLDLAAKRAAQTLLRVDAEFPRIDPRLTGRRHRHLFHATQTSQVHPGFHAIGRSDVESGRTERFSYGSDHMAEEHVFVPASGSSPGGAGWLLGTALDLKRQCTLLSCFRADRLADGPVAQAVLPDALPLGLHGAFLKS